MKKLNKHKRPNGGRVLIPPSFIEALKRDPELLYRNTGLPEDSDARRQHRKITQRNDLMKHVRKYNPYK